MTKFGGWGKDGTDASIGKEKTPTQKKNEATIAAQKGNAENKQATVGTNVGKQDPVAVTAEVSNPGFTGPDLAKDVQVEIADLSIDTRIDYSTYGPRQGGNVESKEFTSIPCPLGVYRDPNNIGLYANNTVIYKDTKVEKYGVGKLLDFDGGQFALEAASGAVVEGSTRITVYGDEATQIPTSWVVGQWVQGGNRPGALKIDGQPKDPATGMELYGWEILDEKRALELPITKEAESYFIMQFINR